jgi:transcriptional regulator with XRE-family HTH domain
MNTLPFFFSGLFGLGVGILLGSRFLRPLTAPAIPASPAPSREDSPKDPEETSEEVIDPSMKSHDTLLRNLMQTAGITTWKELQEQTGFGRSQLNTLRSGQAEKLTLADLERTATVLGLPLTRLLQDFCGISLTGFTESAETSQEVQRLYQQLERQERQFRHQTQAELVEKLKPLLVQYPTLQEVVQRRPDYPAQQVLTLLTSLSNLLEDWHLQPIGQVWQPVIYDPENHQADEDDIQAGESVYVRFVGYRSADQVLIRAKVSRSLPSAAT